jgi:phage shock protein A
LRPVTFHLKTDPRGALYFGLIADEVGKGLPDLVIRRIGPDGRCDDELAPMLLNEVQREQQKIATQAAQLHDVRQQLVTLQAALTKLRPLAAALRQRGAFREAMEWTPPL